MKISREIWKEFNEAARNQMYTLDREGLITNKKLYRIMNNLRELVRNEY